MGGGGGKPRATISVSPASLSFGEVIVGSTSPAQAVSVRNTGTANLTFTSVNTTNAVFTRVNDSPASLDLLLEIARSDPDPEMREKAVFWIGDSDDPRAEAFLLDVLGQ